MISGPDLEFAIPEVRQLGIRLVLAHQSFSQLAHGEVDLTALIWQAQTRLAFGNQGEDADLLARELASVTFDPMRVKDEIWSRRQLVTGHKIIDLASSSNAEAFADNWQRTYAQNWSKRWTYFEVNLARTLLRRARTQGMGSGGSTTRTTSEGIHQSVLPEYEQFLELSSRTYVTFNEHREGWAHDVRKLTTGYGLLWTPDGSRLRHVQVDQMRPGPLAFDIDVIYRRFPQLIEQYERLIEENFAQGDYFVSPAVIELETQTRLAQRTSGPLARRFSSVTRPHAAEHGSLRIALTGAPTQWFLPCPQRAIRAAHRALFQSTQPARRRPRDTVSQTPRAAYCHDFSAKPSVGLRAHPTAAANAALGVVRARAPPMRDARCIRCPQDCHTTCPESSWVCRALILRSRTLQEFDGAPLDTPHCASTIAASWSQPSTGLRRRVTRTSPTGGAGHLPGSVSRPRDSMPKRLRFFGVPRHLLFLDRVPDAIRVREVPHAHGT